MILGDDMSTSHADLTVRAESVQRIYEYYVNRRFRVNRRYQRKLVWTLEEKQTFIDSLRQGLPVPLILAAEESFPGGNLLEIIDGMQRLNAIASFIENEYPLGEAYFDLETLAETKLLKDNGDLTQKTPVLDRRVCVNIANYTIPLSVYRAATDSEVDEVFRRINSAGRHLSRQELRQIGITTSLAELVRIISTRIRGDVSAKDVLPLNDMAQISITSRDLPYGINVDEVFWVREGILTREQVRESRDEEIIAEIIVGMALTPMPPSGSRHMDDFYGARIGTMDRQKQVEAAIARLTPELLERQFISVFDELRATLSTTNKPFAKLVLDNPPPRVPRYFQVVFLAIYTLLVREDKRIIDYTKLSTVIDGIGNRVVNVGGGGGNWSGGQKQENVDAVVGVVGKCFRPTKPGEDSALDSWVTQFENILTQSYTEHSLHDFKQGVYSLDGNSSFSNSAFTKILETLTAMANHGPNATGYILIGVADNIKHAERVKKIYGTDFRKFRGFYVTGIEAEAVATHRSLDNYVRWLVDSIDNSSLDPYLKDSVNRSMRVVRYYDKAILILRVQSKDEPISLQEKFYVRKGTSTVEVVGSALNSLFSRFRT